MIAAPALPLSAALREGSRREHEAAEGAPFVRDLFGSGVTPTRYAAYLSRLLGVYAALESLVRAAPADHLVAGFDDPVLDRVPALRADLSHWAPGPAEPSASPAVRAYADRLSAAAATPTLLVAHHYTRYLGDLSGGRILERRLRDRFGSDGGLAFYRFAHIDRPAAYKRAYRDRLDALPLSAEQRDDVVAEVRTAFRLNHALLEEL